MTTTDIVQLSSFPEQGVPVGLLVILLPPGACPEKDLAAVFKGIGIRAPGAASLVGVDVGGVASTSGFDITTPDRLSSFVDVSVTSTVGLTGIITGSDGDAVIV